jgi:hypothetical protein
MNDRPAHLRAVPLPAATRTVPLAKFLDVRRDAATARRELTTAKDFAKRQAAMMEDFLKLLPLDRREQLKGAGADRVASMTDLEFGVFLGRLETLLDGVRCVVDG